MSSCCVNVFRKKFRKTAQKGDVYGPDRSQWSGIIQCLSGGRGVQFAANNDYMIMLSTLKQLWTTLGRQILCSHPGLSSSQLQLLSTNNLSILDLTVCHPSIRTQKSVQE
ncbi:hypothetical protein SCA6_000393 [Theobroma cacao]